MQAQKSMRPDGLRVTEEVEEVRTPPRLRQRAAARGSKRRDLTISRVVSCRNLERSTIIITLEHLEAVQGLSVALLEEDAATVDRDAGISPTLPLDATQRDPDRGQVEPEGAGDHGPRALKSDDLTAFERAASNSIASAAIS